MVMWFKWFSLPSYSIKFIRSVKSEKMLDSIFSLPKFVPEHKLPLMLTRNRLHEFLVDDAFALTCSGMLRKSEKSCRYKIFHSGCFAGHKHPLMSTRKTINSSTCTKGFDLRIPLFARVFHDCYEVTGIAQWRIKTAEKPAFLLLFSCFITLDLILCLRRNKLRKEFTISSVSFWPKPPHWSSLISNDFSVQCSQSTCRRWYKQRCWGSGSWCTHGQLWSAWASRDWSAPHPAGDYGRPGVTRRFDNLNQLQKPGWLDW